MTQPQPVRAVPENLWRCYPAMEPDGVTLRGYIVECPACGFGHLFYTTPGPGGIDGKGKRPVWSFDGDLENPTFAPSMLVRYGNRQICHSFVQSGFIIFLNDCTHTMAGKRVKLEPGGSAGR